MIEVKIKQDNQQYKLDWMKLQITRICNLSCSYCSQANWRDQMSVDLDLFKKQVIDRMSVRLLIITGGEPMCVFDELIALIRYCKQRNIEIGIFSNATLIDGEKAKLLKEAGTDWVRVSINGPNADIHELSYPNNTFHKTIHGIKCLTEHGIVTKVRATVSKSNINHIENIVKLVKSMGIKELDFRPYLLLGDCNPHESYSLDRDDILNALSVLMYLQKSEKDIRIKLLPNWFDFLFRDLFGNSIKMPLEECHCGKQYIYIDSAGNYRACAGHRKLLGNYHEMTVDNVWNNSAFLNEIRNYSQPEYCRNCPYHIQCHRSNCHLINYEVDNTFDQVNKTCLLYLTDKLDSRKAYDTLRKDFVSYYNKINKGRDQL